MFSSISPREALLACCPPFSLWNLPSFTVESPLFSLYSCSDPLLTCQDAALSHLDSLPFDNLVLWTDGFDPFPFGMGGFGILANSSLCGTEATLSFSAGPVCSSFSAKAGAILHVLAGLGSINKSATSYLFSYYLTLVLSSPPSFILPQCLWQIWKKLSSLSSYYIRLQWVFRHSFFPGNNTADELARQGALLVPFAIPCSFSPLISRIHSSLISDWRRTVSSNFFDTQVSSISIEKLVLPRHARCVLSGFHCSGHSLLLSFYRSKIGRIENPS